MTQAVAWPHLRRGLLAILRGVRASEAVSIVAAIVEEGFEAVEIPLNSPDPFHSIRLVAGAFADRCLIGAGTVMTPAEADVLAECGGRLMVCPNVDATVIAQARALNLDSMPGVFTASEALLALRAGASALKFFPASVLGPAGLAAIRAILPPGTVVCAVGGVTEAAFASYAAIGVSTFGLATSLYRPGDAAQAVRRRARAIVASYDREFPQTVNRRATGQTMVEPGLPKDS
jgi:2-dehydro-3-deoxyphosphogalactonate aldolase